MYREGTMVFFVPAQISGDDNIGEVRNLSRHSGWITFIGALKRAVFHLYSTGGNTGLLYGCRLPSVVSIRPKRCLQRYSSFGSKNPSFSWCVCCNSWKWRVRSGEKHLYTTFFHLYACCDWCIHLCSPFTLMYFIFVKYDPRSSTCVSLCRSIVGFSSLVVYCTPLQHPSPSNSSPVEWNHLVLNFSKYRRRVVGSMPWIMLVKVRFWYVPDQSVTLDH